VSWTESQPLRNLSYLAYIDDSESSTKKDQQKSVQQVQQEQFQVLCAVLLPDVSFIALEASFTTYAIMGYSIGDEFPEEFEFHARDLFHGSGFFGNWEQPKRFQTFEHCMRTVNHLGLPIIYGAVDKAKLAKQIYKSASPLDMSLRLCIEGIQKWFKENDPTEMGLLIADSFDDGKKRNLKRVFRDYRKKLSLEILEQALLDEAHKALAPPQVSSLLDDMYFGDSRDSVGIQAADMCAFLVQRHLANKQDSEWLFNIIEPHISGSVRPESYF
jgi:hypothetical protein